MVRILSQEAIEAVDGKWIKYIEAAGLSTDKKPTENIATGSVFFEVDTSNAYFFDEESGEWTQAVNNGGV